MARRRRKDDALAADAKAAAKGDEGTTSPGSKEELDASLFQLLQDQQNKDAVSTLLKASVCILVLPLLTLFLVYRIDCTQVVFFSSTDKRLLTYVRVGILGFPLEETQKTTLAAVSSVIVVNLVIVAFVVAAWREK
ncbi:hypothetical protein QOT17_010218 [Balamuthia mandrillaris]